MSLPFKPHIIALLCSAGLLAAAGTLYVQSRTPATIAEPPAQQAPAPAASTTQPVAATYTQAQIDQWVAPIALYPDSLLSQVLMASTYPDNVLRFALLGWVGSEMASGLDPFWRPDVVHAHDWHAGLTPAYLAARGRPAKSVFTVHNLAYQGMFYSWHMNDIELPWSFYNMHGLEFNGQISFLKAGLYLSLIHI